VRDLLRRWPVILLLALPGCAGRCGALGGLPPPRPPVVTGPDGQTYHLVTRGPYQAFYDRWGRLHRLEYDHNADGRPDRIAHHGGHRTPRTIEVDDDYDGRTDRWEDYDDDGTLVRVGTARRGGGPDLWTRSDPDGQDTRHEYDDDGDGRPERVELLEAGRVARVELDSDGDGRADRWQRWPQGRLSDEDVDTDHDGRPDRRIRYHDDGRVLGLEPLDR
jgi:hypothetical protein